MMCKLRVVYLILCSMFLFALIGCTIAEFYPEEGEWYCEELQLQLAFGGKGDCFYLIDNEKIICACGSDKGSKWLTVGCQDVDSEYFDLGEEIFGAEFVSLDQNQLIVFDPTTEAEYTFYRVG